MNNPFLSDTFIKIWNKHFNKNITPIKFNFISDITFIKQKFLPVYKNIGLNLTNGISYTLKNINSISDFKNKVFLIYDVPTYFKINQLNQYSKLKLKKSNQYEGVLTDLSNYESFDDFFLTKFKSKSRYNIKKKKKILEKEFNISYSVYDNNITSEQYEFLSKHLKTLITNRFNSLKENNQVISTWRYYEELMLPMLKEKRAVIITVNNNNIPIGMTFNFLSDSILFYAITTFDINYLKYNIGHTTILEITKWCFNNNKKIIDFSKGDTEYKGRWQTDKYLFQNHILYDSSSIKASLLALLIYNYFNLKQYLREIKINVLFSKLKYIFNTNK
ncbi:GNAT family N-acetyltransferase [Algibacter sp. PT7-4]|uniref:GNAT family N-acetyltransferase n=1 Tax=Algibacter ulvanivorans TaxID=3400999 RepID=UPI003AAB6AFB